MRTSTTVDVSIPNEEISEAAIINKLLQSGTYMLILSGLHFDNPDSTYSHQFPYILVLEPMLPRPRKI